MSLNITIIGCGEVGYAYAEAISKIGYKLQLCTPRPSERILKLASDNNIKLHKQFGDWLNNTDIVICCTPGSAALSVAKEVVLFLKKGALFADFSTTSPENKIKAASLARSKEISFVDVAIMGSVNLHQASTPLLFAGNETEKIVTVMQKIGATIRVLENGKVGDAAFIKLLRSIFMKGLSALTIECVVAAQYYGVKELLYETLSDLNQTPISEFLDMFLRHHVVHACRQRHEVAEAAQQLKSSGLPLQMLPAIEDLFATTCEFIKMDPIDHKNPTTEEALVWLLKTRRSKKSTQ
ncbi:MAG TPA: NAD(P)-binding domain-containing protein [Gammaproteobacteria bacterium]|nr:NAD(P)-binding domain-containing protein [Gammaproteobacteria bacterium]